MSAKWGTLLCNRGREYFVAVRNRGRILYIQSAVGGLLFLMRTHIVYSCKDQKKKCCVSGRTTDPTVQNTRPKKTLKTKKNKLFWLMKGIKLKLMKRRLELTYFNDLVKHR
jgi:hypothetical protein